MATGVGNGADVARPGRQDWSAIAPGAETVAAGQFAVAAVFWQTTSFAEAVDDPYGRGFGGGIGLLFGLAFTCLVLPLLAFAAGWVHSTLVTVPVMELSHAAGVRTRIPAPVWSLPALAALGALYAAPVALLTPAPYAATWGWLTAAGVLPVAVAVHARMRQRNKASVRRRARGTAAVAVVAAFAAGIAWSSQSAGPYRPPVLAHAEYVGEWTGDGVRLELDARGTVMAEKLPVHDGFEVVDRCSGRGTWESREADELHRAGVVLAVPECGDASLVWAVAGTAEEPELFVLIGDPDGGDVRVLRKREG
ncbi:hypothetical protein [Streptomyces sp. TBY4]|uniref:hypothetical protein n=1 Tax=Streptomyces sp. TBY4 TaxID=2962030 RepID=UPI0020B8A7C5|nr:hypothetical protein [Streptomyces sp. TBY4]MCP3760424.1 hypothetical protein [Streptomyces sp. TBY4]